MNAHSAPPGAAPPVRRPDRGPTRPGRRALKAASLAALVSLAAVSSLLAGVVTAPTATGTQRPAAPVALPATAEALAPVLPQVSCDPVAKPGVVAFRAMVLATYGQGRDGGIIRECHIGAVSHHKEGRAWDWMLDLTTFHHRRAGAHLIRWLMADEALMARRLGLNYIIWQQRIWSTFLHTEGWRPYTGPNPHLDHIHFSFTWAGALKRTSWWTGQVAPRNTDPAPPPTTRHRPTATPSTSPPARHSTVPRALPGRPNRSRTGRCHRSIAIELS